MTTQKADNYDAQRIASPKTFRRPAELCGRDSRASWAMLAPERSCPLCGTPCDSAVQFVSKYRLAEAEEEVPWLRCEDCGTYFMSKVPDSDEVIAHVAGTEYGRQEFSEAIGAQKQRLHAQILGELLRLNHSAKAILDYGCSFGVFLRIAEDHGLSAYGLDTNPLAVDVVKSQGGKALLGDDISAAKAFGMRFSAIVMNDVICYVKDPISAFRTSLELLEPGGVLILRVSNKALWLSLGLRLPGLRETVVAGCCHDHFHVADVAAYLSALKRAGFASVEAGPTATSADPSELSWLGRAIYRFGRATRVLTRGSLRIDPGILITASKGA